MTFGVIFAVSNTNKFESLFYMMTFRVTSAVSNTGKFESLLYMTFRVTSAVSNTGKFESLLYMTFRVTSAVSNTGKFESLLYMTFRVTSAVSNTGKFESLLYMTFRVTSAVSNTGKFESLLYMTFRVTSAVSNTGKFESLPYLTFRVTSAVSNTGKFESLLNYTTVFGIIVAVPNNYTKARTESRFLHTTGSSKQETMVTITQSSRPWTIFFSIVASSFLCCFLFVAAVLNLLPWLKEPLLTVLWSAEKLSDCCWVKCTLVLLSDLWGFLGFVTRKRHWLDSTNGSPGKWSTWCL